MLSYLNLCPHGLQSCLALWSPHLGKRESWSVCFSSMCLFILNVSLSVLFRFLLVSGVGCDLCSWLFMIATQMLYSVKDVMSALLQIKYKKSSIKSNEHILKKVDEPYDVVSDI